MQELTMNEVEEVSGGVPAWLVVAAKIAIIPVSTPVALVVGGAVLVGGLVAGAYYLSN